MAIYIGAGIHVFRDFLTRTIYGPRSLPNNGLVISLNTPSKDAYFIWIFCRSDSMIDNVGMLIGLNGIAITTNGSLGIAHPQPGELTVENRPSQSSLTARDQGVYTCRIPLQSGELRDINIGIYPSGFTSKCL